MNPSRVQLANDGKSFWSNGVWVSSTSADGTSRWDGHGWVPQQRTFFQNVPDETTDIDDRSMASSSSPATIKSFPTPASYADRHVAVGSGWLGMKNAPGGGVAPDPDSGYPIHRIGSAAKVPPDHLLEIADDAQTVCCH
jgi:hypothetical protein